MKIKYLGNEHISDLDLKSLGGKATNLHYLKKAGFQVPAGFIYSKGDDLAEAIKEIGGYPVAVRSSCSLEDMSDASFAGLYETYLNVQNEIELKQKVQDCLDSKNSDRVHDYLKVKEIQSLASELKMTVLIQKMVEPLISGVLFTLNPKNGFEEEYYLEFCAGLGERLVSGHVTPTSYTFNIRENKVTESLVNQEATEISPIHLNELITQAKKIQAFFGTPQDIEWAIDLEGQLQILQSRPITTVTYRADVPELTNADLKDGGISARVCTPLMFSVYRNALQFSMGDYFKRIQLIKNPEDIIWIYMFYGKVYWNAGAVKDGLRLIPGFNEQDFDRDLGIQKDYGAKGPSKTPLTLSTLTNAIPVMIGLYKEFQDCEIMVDQFRSQFERQDQVLKQKLSDLKDYTDEEFFKWLNDVINFQVQTERNYFRTIYNNSNYQTEFKTKLKKIKNYREGDEIDLMSSLEDVSHINVQEDLSVLAKIAQIHGMLSQAYHRERENFLLRHYHHGPAELDLTVPRWGERKDWVDDLVKSFQFREKVTHSTHHEILNRLTNSMGYFSRKSFVKTLNRSRNFLKIREEMRSFSTRAYYLLRLGLLDFSRRLGINEMDVFMYDINEILHFLNSSKQSLPNTEERFLQYQGYRSFSSPNEFGGQIIQSVTLQTNGALKGIGCSSGEKIGVARVILDIHQTSGLTKDDILVTRFTDPGWTPVLARVGGVITEVGGLLSHAAVIGREYGIPAILNLNHATKLIKDGSRIKMNGKTGIVELLEEGS